MSKSPTEQKVEIFHRINRLKIKAGSTKDGPPVKFSKERLEDPQRFMNDLTDNYNEELEVVLNDLETAWKGLLSQDKDTILENRETLYHKANHVKDLAATCNYPLMQHFGLSLREFIEKIDPENKDHHTIVRAHLDVMWIVKKENIHDEGGDKAKELKNMVLTAIKQHS